MTEVEGLEATSRLYLSSRFRPLSIKHNLLSRDYCLYQFVQKNCRWEPAASSLPELEYYLKTSGQEDDRASKGKKRQSHSCAWEALHLVWLEGWMQGGGGEMLMTGQDANGF